MSSVVQKREKSEECLAAVENSTTTLEKQPVLAPDQNSREINVESSDNGFIDPAKS